MPEINPAFDRIKIENFFNFSLETLDFKASNVERFARSEKAVNPQIHCFFILKTSAAHLLLTSRPFFHVLS